MECTKAPRCGGDYQNKLSGPLLDRIDLQVEVGAVSIADLAQGADGEMSSVVAGRVCEARGRQEERYKALGDMAEGIIINAHATTEILEQVIRMDAAAKDMFAQAADRLKLSARSYHRLMKVALTLSDLEGGADDVTTRHVAQALSYRRLRVG